MSYLLAKDTVNGAAGKVFITVDGRNIEPFKVLDQADQVEWGPISGVYIDQHGNLDSVSNIFHDLAKFQVADCIEIRLPQKRQ